jgi:hypothetical protein
MLKVKENRKGDLNKEPRSPHSLLEKIDYTLV